MNRYAHSTFCDDIRHEVGGKLTLVGIYAGDLLVPTFPCVLPKLCLVLNILTSRSQPFQRLKIRILKDEETLAEGELPMQDLTASVSDAIPEDGESDETKRLLGMTAHFVFSPLKLDGPGVIRVFVETEDEEMRAPGLRIAQMQAISLADLGGLGEASEQPE
ncbi:MAG TPA: hypothetical protein VMV98_01620 [Acidobacteriaceae bacterium]|nr:hypothetical protein [Acidobacteriaceae bacterium]